MKKFRLTIAAMLTTVFAFSGMMVFTVPAFAADPFGTSRDAACNGANLQDTGGCTGANDQSGRVSDTLAAIVNILSLVVGVVAVIMLIIGGLRFITSQGDAGSTALARNTIIYALVGIVVAVLAQFLVKFVIQRATAPPSAATSSTNKS